MADDIMIRPAVEGTQRVLGAAVRNGVQRVVQTSSVAAVAYGYEDKNRTFSEKDWSRLDGKIEPYQKSKTLAEKAAWDFVNNLPAGQSLELATVCPGYVLGPVINDRQPTSTSLHKMLMEGREWAREQEAKNKKAAIPTDAPGSVLRREKRGEDERLKTLLEWLIQRRHEEVGSEDAYMTYTEIIKQVQLLML